MAKRNQFEARQYTETTASCSKCHSMKLFSEFPKDKSGKFGIGYWCRECTNRLARNNHRRRYGVDAEFMRSKRNSYVKLRHGLSLDKYTEKLLAQDCKCAICGVKLPTSGPLTHLDHCHKTGKIRAFLCTNCNRGLGHFQDSIDNLQRAIDYLQTHTDSVDIRKGDENL